MTAMHMRYLTIEQRETLQATLMARAEMLRSGIAESLDRQDGGARALPNHSEETDDDAIVDLETSLDVARLSRNVDELREIDHALGRLHAPEYGLQHGHSIHPPAGQPGGAALRGLPGKL